MKRRAPLPLLVLLLLPVLVTGCATKAMTIPVEYAAEYMIKNHRGVGAAETDSAVLDPRGPEVAAQLTSAMREALSSDQNKYNLVSLDQQSEIDEFLEEKGGSFDQIDADAMDEFVKLFGHEIPATAWITSRLVKLDIVTREPVQGYLVETGIFDVGRAKDAMVRTGRVEVHWEVGLLEVGSRTQPVVKVLKQEAEARETAALDQVPPEIDVHELTTQCVSNLKTDFELLFTNSTQTVTAHLFIGDGFMHMPWEDNEFIELKVGAERMTNKQYGYACDEYQKLVDRLQPHGGEMLARAYYNLGLCYEVQGELELAFENYEKAVALSTHSIISQGHTRCKKRIGDRELIEAEVDRRIEA